MRLPLSTPGLQNGGGHVPGWDVPQMETSCLSETGLLLLQKNLCNSFTAGKSLQFRLNCGQGLGGKVFLLCFVLFFEHKNVLISWPLCKALLWASPVAQ